MTMAAEIKNRVGPAAANQSGADRCKYPNIGGTQSFITTSILLFIGSKAWQFLRNFDWFVQTFQPIIVIWWETE